MSVLAGILGQALLFGYWRLIVYGALSWLACHLFVLAYEEPTLQGVPSIKPFVRTSRVGSRASRRGEGHQTGVLREAVVTVVPMTQ